MICILKHDAIGKLVGWMMGHDTHELRGRAQIAGDTNLAEMLYRVEFPAKGKHELGGGYTMLVE
jgi:hypothetical protein